MLKVGDRVRVINADFGDAPHLSMNGAIGTIKTHESDWLMDGFTFFVQFITPRYVGPYQGGMMRGIPELAADMFVGNGIFWEDELEVL